MGLRFSQRLFYSIISLLPISESTYTSSCWCNLCMPPGKGCHPFQEGTLGSGRFRRKRKFPGLMREPKIWVTTLKLYTGGNSGRSHDSWHSMSLLFNSLPRLSSLKQQPFVITQLWPSAVCSWLSLALRMWGLLETEEKSTSKPFWIVERIHVPEAACLRSLLWLAVGWRSLLAGRAVLGSLQIGFLALKDGDRQPPSGEIHLVPPMVDFRKGLPLLSVHLIETCPLRISFLPYSQLGHITESTYSVTPTERRGLGRTHTGRRTPWGLVSMSPITAGLLFWVERATRWRTLEEESEKSWPRGLYALRGKRQTWEDHRKFHALLSSLLRAELMILLRLCYSRHFLFLLI